MRVMTPRGVRDFLPQEAARKRAVEAALQTTFRRWGYEEVITPTVEFLESFAQSNSPDIAEKMYRLFDREGHILALRPEVTTPIARIVSTRLQGDPLPLRLHYVANVFRHEEVQAGRQREFWQAGVELVGAEGPLADAEIVALAVTALAAAGLRDFRIDIGQVGYFNGIIADVNLDDGVRRALRRALLRRDYVALPDVVAQTGLPAEKQRLLNELPKLQGRKEALERALALADNEQSKAAAENALAVYEALEAYGVQDRVWIDFGMIKDLDYYTGMVLEGYTPDSGFPVCTGGRYDQLLGKYGFACPATGFVVGVERLMQALDAQGSGQAGRSAADTWFVASNATGRAVAVEAALRLRERGAHVVVDVEEERPLHDALAFARERQLPLVMYVTEDRPRVFRAPDYGEVAGEEAHRLLGSLSPVGGGNAGGEWRLGDARTGVERSC